MVLYIRKIRYLYYIIQPSSETSKILLIMFVPKPTSTLTHQYPSQNLPSNKFLYQSSQNHHRHTSKTQHQFVNLQTPFCRICLEESTKKMKLLAPCNCQGSVEHIHQKCLKKWITSLLNRQNKAYEKLKDDDRVLNCEICSYPIKYQIRTINFVNIVLAIIFMIVFGLGVGLAFNKLVTPGIVLMILGLVLCLFLVTVRSLCPIKIQKLLYYRIKLKDELTMKLEPKESGVNLR